MMNERTNKENGKCGDPSPFDYAQGQDDGVKTGNGNSNSRSLRDDKQKDKLWQERTTARTNNGKDEIQGSIRLRHSR